ncbi:UNVERIFIED_CONTAM: hypothetical protein Sradi_6996400 [Sesamum radiatum]|uniref:CCHC-type domain-containing protein n=1 Tax=Sesamum radiatum TaxID=300843 RepID=A0AAW2JD50_SESRA
MAVVRSQSHVDLPPPRYHPGTNSITVSLYYGGEFITLPEARYKSSSVKKFDYADASVMNKRELDHFCDKVNIRGGRTYYIIMNKGFKLLVDDNDIKVQCLKHVGGSEMQVFIELENLEQPKEASEQPMIADNGKGIVEDEGGINCESGDNCGDSDSLMDSDYDMVDESIDDDAIFENYVDGEDNMLHNMEEINTVGSGDDSGDVDVVDSDDDLDENRLSDGEGGGSTHPVFNPVEMYNPTFELGMIFSTKKEFRQAVQSHAILTKRTLKFIKNDKIRVYAVCTGEDCQWKITAIKVKNECTFKINHYNSEHTCPQSFHVKNVKTSWLSEKYTQKFKSDPKRNVKGFRVDVMNELRCHVSKDQAYRAKRQALKKLEGSPEYQYTRLWDYAEEIRKTNPGSTVILGTENENGELLGLIPINNIYPIAYAVVRNESGETWEWFLTVLKQDLNILRCYEYTFMSDKQKGLINAFQTVFPQSVHRFCVRHMHNNFKTAGFRGLAFKNALWKAARASTIGEYKMRMDEMKMLDASAYEWFIDKPPQAWSRKWDISGIPCKHAISAIFNQNEMPENYVHEYYSVDTYKRVYAHAIMGISGEILWDKSLYIPPLPPNFGRGPGRPSSARRREPDEPIRKTKKKNIRLKRQQTTLHCRACGEPGHNQSACPEKAPGPENVIATLQQMTKRTGDNNENIYEALAHEVNENDQIDTQVSAAPIIKPPTTLIEEPAILIEEPELDPQPEDVTSEQLEMLTMPGPSMYSQLQMTHPPLPTQSQSTLYPRLNIRGPPPMTGTLNMPVFSYRPAGMVETTKSIIQEGGHKYVELSKWTSKVDSKKK